MDSPEEIPDIVPLFNGGPSQNFGLRPEEFNEMISKLMTGDDSLFEHIFLSHFEICRSYVSSKYNIEYETSYDITMDTLLEFRRKLMEGKISYGNTRYLFTRMACNNYVMQVRQDQKLKEILSNEEIPEDAHEEQIHKLNLAWQKLDESEKSLLTGYYYEGQALKDMAVSMNIPDTTLRKKKQRAMDHLREHFFSLNIQ